MEKRFSEIYKRKGKSFRYDFERQLVSYVYVVKEDDEILDEKKGEIIELDTAGLKVENWKNKESRNMYLDEFIYDIEEELKYMI